MSGHWVKEGAPPYKLGLDPAQELPFPGPAVDLVADDAARDGAVVSLNRSRA
jgi:hypothetical protein